MKRLNLLLIGAALALPALSQAATQGGIEGSVHDFSGQTTWNSRAGVCSPCHAAHHTDPAQIVPLWVHATSRQTFTMYDSPSMDATVSTSGPKGASLACLSCHDGVTAINASISATNPTTPVLIDPSAAIGTDLHTTHPISFTYDASLAAADGGLENPDTYRIGDPKANLSIKTPPVPVSWSGISLTGKTISDAMLTGGQMECSSCHDVHKLKGSSPTSGILAKISGNDSDGRGSTLCRTCHIK